MAKSGILGQSKLAATTTTLLYKAPIGSAASAVLTVANDGTGAAYDVAIKDYSQKVTVDAATYKLHEGDVISNHRFTLSTSLSSDATINPGSTLTSDDGEKTAKFHAFYIPDITTVYVKSASLRVITLATGNTGTFAAGDTVTKGTGGDTTTALCYDFYDEGGVNYILVGASTINGSGSEFAAGDTMASGSDASGTISTGGVATAVDKFIFSTTTAGGTYDLSTKLGISFFDDRTYRFNVSDSSMTGRTFKLSTTVNGEYGPDGDIATTGDNGTEYTTGKTTNGTAGSSGAYVQYAFAGSGVAETMYYYDGDTGSNAGGDWGSRHSAHRWGGARAAHRRPPNAPGPARAASWPGETCPRRPPCHKAEGPRSLSRPNRPKAAG